VSAAAALRDLMQEHAALLDRIIEFEGTRLTDDPADPGGLTYYGITFRTWDAADGTIGDDSPADFRRMTLPEARAFYAANFLAPFAWLVEQWPIGFEDRAVFAAAVDYAIHSGPRTAAMALQAAIDVTVDGRIGPKTRGAWRALNASERDLVWRKLLATRLIDLGRQVSDQKIERSPKDKAKFCEGWLTRIAHQLVAPVPA
jgi:lysozyme family protein